jgi:spore germination cell wall hydrolase CwlJ-like protein
MIKPLILGTMLVWGGYEYVAYSVDKTAGLESQVSEMKETISDLRNRNDIGAKELVMFNEKTAFKYNSKDVECLARNIFFEAGVEGTMGKYAVAQITINRLQTGYWGNTICNVVYSPDQFSWTDNPDLKTVKLKSKNWYDSRRVAQTVLRQGLRIKILSKSLFYHADYVSPKWKDNDSKVAKIGRHIFYDKAKGTWWEL